jgi:hypothetical protein
MDLFSAKPKQKEEVIKLYHKIYNKSTELNGSRPRSIACGLIYYWIVKNKKNITLSQFVSTVNLSQLTVTRITNIITSILDKDDSTN